MHSRIVESEAKNRAHSSMGPFRVATSNLAAQLPGLKSMLGIILLGIIFLAAPSARAQAWSGILNSSRATNWQRATVGVSGGVPSAGWTQCGATIAAYTGSAAAINNAISSCGQNQYVLLGAGTFALSTPITVNGKNNVVLRGSGPNQTVIAPSGNTPCGNGRGSGICAGGGLFVGGGQSLNLTPPCGGSGSTNCFNLTTPIHQGSSSITISNVGSAGIHNGDQITIDQANDTTDTGGYMVCDSVSPVVCHQSAETPSGNGRLIGGVEYSQQQFLYVVSGCASACSGGGPFTLTVSPPIYANNWDGHLAAGGWFVPQIHKIGFENLTIDGSNLPGGGYNISFYNCEQCWVKNVRSLSGGRAHLNVFMSPRNEVRDSYFFGTKAGSNQSYGIEPGEPGGSSLLIENNIFQGIASPVVGGGFSGSVIAYNFSVNNVYSPSTYLQATYSSHDAADNFQLYEGNIFNSITCDDIHGTPGGVNTYFRNWLNGRDWNQGSQPTQQTFPVDLDAYCRGFNIIGNVLGTPGYHTNYQQFAGQSGGKPSAATCNLTIYELGWGGGICSNLGSGGVADDNLVYATLMRWGNYDTVTGGVKWDAAESSPGAVPYISAQTTPASHGLPASFYLSSAPSFFGSVPFPPIGPDVTGGTGPGGFANLIPAAKCYYSNLLGPANGSGGALPFDAKSCYGSSTTTSTPPPANLATVVQ